MVVVCLQGTWIGVEGDFEDYSNESACLRIALAAAWRHLLSWRHLHFLCFPFKKKQLRPAQTSDICAFQRLVLCLCQQCCRNHKKLLASPVWSLQTWRVNVTVKISAAVKGGGKLGTTQSNSLACSFPSPQLVFPFTAIAAAPVRLLCCLCSPCCLNVWNPQRTDH